jgi:predicted chitinase
MITGNEGQIFIGVVEDRNDHLCIGRARVRVAGLHTHDKEILPTEDLPWAMLMQPASGGNSAMAVAPTEGTSVIVMFNDWPQNQQPIIIGVLAGIPQGDPVSIDKFEDPPLWKDSIAPAGRDIPITPSMGDGNYIGPIQPGAETPLLSSIVSQSQTQSSQTRQGMVNNILYSPSLSMGAVGGLSTTIGGIGTLSGFSKDNYVNLLLTTGNKDQALDSFIKTSIQSGSMGSAFGALLSGKVSLQSLGSILNVNLSTIQASLGLVTQLSARSLISSSLISTNFSSILGESSSFTDQISIALTGAYSSTSAAVSNTGNINVLVGTPTTSIDSTSFEEVGEGTTPPVRGIYGGPNFAGASPVIVPPTQSMSKYEGGSSRPIVMTPPNNWSGSNRALVNQNINILINACAKYGLTTKEQQSALLGIIGGECGWIPKEEGCKYSSPDRLCGIFQSTFKGDMSLAETYCNWSGSKADFFNFVYDPANNGRQLGNTQPGDGGKFYGRGFIQLTGRAKYKMFSSISGYDIINNPDVLVSDPKISAEIAVLYLLSCVKRGAVPTAHPGYFYAARDAVGHTNPQSAALKLSYYEHFYGQKSPESFGYADKQAGSTNSPFSYDGSQCGNESGKTDNRGFQDPHKKYPLKRYLNEPETNRLARGRVDETIVQLKDSKRKTGIQLPFEGGSWSQPKIPFGAKYPYNHVRETESGHVQEFDDTPGYERIHTYHRSGTFQEIDAQGTMVTKIVGEGYVIFDRNGFISITGDANVSVAGNVNVYCKSDAAIQVEGSAELKVGGSLDIGVACDMNIAVEGDFSVWANGNFNVQAKNKGNILAGENLYVSATNQLHLQSTSEMFIESKTDLGIKSTADLKLFGPDVYINSTSTTNINSDDTTNVDGTAVNINKGTSIKKDVGSAIKALVHGMVPPAVGTPIYPQIDTLSGPEFMGQDGFMFEHPEDGQTAASQTYNQERLSVDGKTNTFEGDSVGGSGGVDSFTPSSRQSEILSMVNFTADFKLSDHFTLGMLFANGFNIQHRLIDQCGLTRQQIVANLASLCENILEKYLSVLPNGIQGYNNKWRITSGYRMQSASVNSPTSDHPKGRACDIQLTGRNKDQHYDLVKQLDKLVPYDQMILEYAGSNSVWIHTGFRGNGGTVKTYGTGSVNRKMAFTMKDSSKIKDGFVLLG